MLKKILLAVAFIIIALVVVVALRPSEYRITRTATMAAPAATVFDQVNHLRNWEAWSPWAKLDPAMKQTYEGPPSGVDSVYSWAGNSQVGEGRMTITASRPSELVRINLQFLKPFASTSTTEFTFKPEGNQTTVTWSMEGKNNFMAKAFTLFMNMDKMVGGQFEQGLAQMKSLVEAGSRK